MMMLIFNFGEVFIVRLPFTSGQFSKARPVLVLFDAQDDVVVCRVTSDASRGERDVTLQKWHEAGLAKPSVARLDRLVTTEKSLLIKRIGLLHDEDLAAVRTAWNRLMAL